MYTRCQSTAKACLERWRMLCPELCFRFDAKKSQRQKAQPRYFCCGGLPCSHFSRLPYKALTSLFAIHALLALLCKTLRLVNLYKYFHLQTPEVPFQITSDRPRQGLKAATWFQTRAACSRLDAGCQAKIDDKVVIEVSVAESH